MFAFLFPCYSVMLSVVPVSPALSVCSARVPGGCVAFAGLRGCRVPPAGEKSLRYPRWASEGPKDLWQHHQRLQVWWPRLPFPFLIQLYVWNEGDWKAAASHWSPRPCAHSDHSWRCVSGSHVVHRPFMQTCRHAGTNAYLCHKGGFASCVQTAVTHARQRFISFFIM